MPPPIKNPHSAEPYEIRGDGGNNPIGVGGGIAPFDRTGKNKSGKFDEIIYGGEGNDTIYG